MVSAVVSIALCYQAVKVEAQLDARFLNSQAWESLSITAHKAWSKRKVLSSAETVLHID